MGRPILYLILSTMDRYLFLTSREKCTKIKIFCTKVAMDENQLGKLQFRKNWCYFVCVYLFVASRQTANILEMPFRMHVLKTKTNHH
jgi:hypothetical protein